MVFYQARGVDKSTVYFLACCCHRRAWVAVDALEVKRRIKLMRGLPALPHLAREAARCVPGRPADLEELAAIASFEPEVSRLLAREAPQARTVRDAVFLLGVDAVRRIAFTHAVPAMFPPAADAAHDRDMFWRHARLSGAYAAALARQTEAAHAPIAYVAALLHNIGRLALDTVAPEACAAIRAASAADNRTLVEAERRETGVDHTLAGKWLLENWGLPEPYIAAAWLHHHPPGALDETRYPVRLVELVRLAGLLAARTLESDERNGAVTADETALLKCLGLTEAAAQQVIDEQTAVAAQKPVSPPRITPPAATDTQRRLERRLGRLDLLERLHTHFAEARHVGGVLDALALHIRDAFHVPWGLCYAAETELACLEGRCWGEGQGPLTAFSLPLGGVSAAMSGDLDAALPAAFAAAAQDMQDGLLSGTTLESLVQRPGFIVAPMTAGGAQWGRIFLDTTDMPGGFTEEDFADMRLFARAAAVALARLRNVQTLQQRTEEMADALLAHEADFQWRLRSERLSGIAALAAGAAHEINNPLAVISGRAQMMLNRSSTGEDAHGLETIIEQSRRASRILTDLMQFARPPEPNLEPSVITFILRQVVASFRERLERRGIRIVEDYADRMPRVRLDRRRIEQVFIHLIVNAEKAMGGKGGVLTVRARASEDRRHVLLQFADTDPGVPPELRGRIFEPFYTTRAQGEGTGLGLAVCHGIIESHRGQISVGDEPGQGAVFHIALPAAADISAVAPRPAETAPERPAPRAAPRAPEREAAEAAPSPAEARAPAARGTGPALGRAPNEPRAILVVDDDVDLREVLKEIFQGRGYRALSASDGVEAAALLAGHRIDLVVLDIRMPRQDGLGVLRHIREQDPALPVIVVTGMATEDELREAAELGIRACLHKPFELKRLLAEIEEALGSRHAA